jgi:hypothetical protein
MDTIDKCVTTVRNTILKCFVKEISIFERQDFFRKLRADLDNLANTPTAGLSEEYYFRVCSTFHHRQD